MVGAHPRLGLQLDPAPVSVFAWSALMLAHRSPVAAVRPDDGHRRPNLAGAQWIHGALVPSAQYSSVCSTSNGCTSTAFLSCADAAQKISNITFASYGNPSECPIPRRGSCHHPDSLNKARAACLGRTNCSVAKHAFSKLSCSVRSPCTCTTAYTQLLAGCVGSMRVDSTNATFAARRMRSSLARTM
eukprot:COSAG01_NODE_10551_length_2134_cov_2.284521_1_plen_187_part_00